MQGNKRLPGEPICASDASANPQKTGPPGLGRRGVLGVGGPPAAPRNSQTYFSNLWTDNKSTLRPGQRVIHQREMAANWATMRREQDEAHICTEVTLRARVCACTASQFVPVLCCQTAKFQPPSRQTRKHFFFFLNAGRSGRGERVRREREIRLLGFTAARTKR